MTKDIWMYWHQGFENAPPVVSKCVESWRRHHPQWQLHLLDKNNISDFVEPIDVPAEKVEKLSLAHRSDLIRTQLLIKFGGVWADPTCYCVQPLDDWLPAKMKAGLFMFHKPGRDRLISNWFIAAEKGNVFLEKLYSALCRYWQVNSFLSGPLSKKLYSLVSKVLNRRVETTRLWFTILFTRVLRLSPYMVYHYKFYELTITDAQCKSVWEDMPKVSADGPHILQRIGLLKEATPEVKSIVEEHLHPLFKLTWKINHSTLPHGCMLQYLLEREQ